MARVACPTWCGKPPGANEETHSPPEIIPDSKRQFSSRVTHVQIGNQIHERGKSSPSLVDKYRHGPEQIALSILVCSLPCMDTVQLSLVDKIAPWSWEGALWAFLTKSKPCPRHCCGGGGSRQCNQLWSNCKMKLTDGDWQRQKNVLFVARKTTSLQDQLRHTQ
jgi:hypothetical protein